MRPSRRGVRLSLVCSINAGAGLASFTSKSSSDAAVWHVAVIRGVHTEAAFASAKCLTEADPAAQKSAELARTRASAEAGQQHRLPWA